MALTGGVNMGNAIYTNGVRVRNMRHKLIVEWNKSRKVRIVVNLFEYRRVNL